MESIIEKQKSEINIVEKHPAIKKNIQILKQILLPLELSCLQLIMYIQRPIPTASFYIDTLNRTCKRHFSTEEIGETITKTPAKIKEIEKLPNKIFSKLDLTSKDVATGLQLEADELRATLILHGGLSKKILKTKLDKDLISHTEKLLKRGLTLKVMTKYAKLSETKRIRIKEIVLRKLNIYFPSYPKIMQTLETLEKWNFITRRSENIKKKANFYWILNPQFSLEFQDKFQDIIKL